MKDIEIKRTYCSKCRKIRTCHIKNDKYFCAACYIRANRVLAPSGWNIRKIFIL